MKQLKLMKTLLVATLMCVGLFTQEANATVVSYDLTGKFSGTSTACGLSDDKITTPELIANELNKNATYSFTWSGSPRAKGDGTGVDVSTANNGTFTISGLSGGEMIIVKLHAVTPNNSQVFKVKKGQKCIVNGVNVETVSDKTVSFDDGTYVPIYMKSGATSLTVTSESKYTILESVIISTANIVYERNVTYGDANIWTSADVTAWGGNSNLSIDVPENSDDTGNHYGLGHYTKPTSFTSTKSFDVSSSSKIKYELMWYFGEAPGMNKAGDSFNYNFIQFGDKVRLSWRQGTYKLYLSTDGASGLDETTPIFTGSNTQFTKNITIIFNTATSTVEYFGFDGSDYTSNLSGALAGDFNKISIGFVRNTTPGYNSPNRIKDLKVTEYMSLLPYTINYTYGGSIIKSEESTAVLGSTVNASYSYFWDDGATQKYYVADNATTSFTIGESGNTFEVALREAASDAVASVNAVDALGNVLATFTGGSGIEGEAYDGYVYYTRAVYSNGQYYTVAAANGTGINYGKNGLVYGTPGTVTYTLDETISYYAETENLTLSGTFRGEESVKERASGGDWHRLSAKAYLYTPSGELSTGVYTLEISGRNQNSSSGSLDIKVRTSEGTLGSVIGSPSWDGSSNAIKTISNILVPENASIAICNGNSTSNICLDYIIIRKVYDVTDASKILGNVNKSSSFTQSDAYTLKKGETKVFTFTNHGYGVDGDSQTKSWYNWTIGAYDGATQKAFTRADFWDNEKGATTGYEEAMSTDGGSTKTWLNWDMFKDDMDNATIVATLSYSTDGTYSISAVQTGHVHNNIYYVNHSVSELTANELNIKLGVEYSWSEILSVEQTAVGMTIGEATWASFSNANEVAIPSGVTAYYASASDGSSVTLKPIDGDYIPANTGVVLNGTAGTYSADVTSTSAAIAGTNLLHPWLTAGTPSEETYYTLAAGPTFKKSIGGTLAAGKAYLVLPTSARELSVVFDNETNGIQQVESAAQSKGAYYNLAGQRIAQPTKGLYIVNGKKVVIK